MQISPWPALHGLLHRPQWVLSNCVFTQIPAHSVCDGEQAHRPPEQVCPPEHTLPQAPQLLALVCKLTQAPLHSAWPLGHWHCPVVRLQACPPEQLPQSSVVPQVSSDPQILPWAAQVVGVQIWHMPLMHCPLQHEPPMPGPHGARSAIHVGQQGVLPPHPELLTEPSGIVVRQKMALYRLVALVTVAPLRLASTRQEPLRFAFVRLAPLRLAPRRLARLILQPVQSSVMVGL